MFNSVNLAVHIFDVNCVPLSEMMASDVPTSGMLSSTNLFMIAFVVARFSAYSLINFENVSSIDSM